MSGLFVNFFECKFSKHELTVKCLSYDNYRTEQAYKILKDSHKDWMFYRDGDNIYYWNLVSTAVDDLKGRSTIIKSHEKPRVFTKILETAIVERLKSLSGYAVSYHNYSHTWRMVSERDLLNRSIEGLIVRRQVNLSVHYYQPGNRLLFGIVLSAAIQNDFLWSLKEFEQHGIDPAGLKSENNTVFATKQALKRFLVARGASDQYDQKIQELSSNAKEFEVIKGFHDWLSKRKAEVYLPDNTDLTTISLRYLPYADDNIAQEILPNPKRYYFGGRTHDDQQRAYYNEQVKKYKPYSFELFDNKPVKIGILCPKEYEGIIEGFVNKLERVIRNDLHVMKIRFEFCYTDSTAPSAYKDKLYDSKLLSSQLVIVIVNEDHVRLPARLSPYHMCKAKYIGNGIPTQDIQVQNVKNPNQFILNNIALNIYAKLGGTAWTIEKEEKRKDELIIGVGSTMDSNGRHVLGIAQIFHADGRYLVGDCAPISTFDNYVENLQSYLHQTLLGVVDHHIDKSREFRIIFHLFKSASSRYEIRAIENVIRNFSHLKFQYAFVHLGYGHNFRLYFNDGKDNIRRGTLIKLDSQSALIHFVPESSIPLLVQLDKRSSFKDLYYVSKQIYWFSNLSHRSYMPAKKTVTISYPSLMATLTEKLKLVEGWDYDRLKNVSDKIWFI